MKPGIHTLTADEYHSDPADQPSLSASIAHLLTSRSPLHAWTAHPRLNPEFARQEESKYDVGTCAHALLLEGKPMEEVARVVYLDSWRTKAAKELRDEARAEGKIPLLEKDADAVLGMLGAARSQLVAHEASPTPFADGKPEQTLIWEEDGITCRALVDWLHEDQRVIYDLKTTSASANPESWSRTCFQIGADVQTAFYLRGLQQLTGIHAEMRYVVVETYPPYALSINSLSPAALEVGRAKVKRAMELWRECLANDSWPGYPSRVAYAELPAWEEARWLEREWSAAA